MPPLTAAQTLLVLLGPVHQVCPCLGTGLCSSPSGLCLLTSVRPAPALLADCNQFLFPALFCLWCQSPPNTLQTFAFFPCLSSVSPAECFRRLEFSRFLCPRTQGSAWCIFPKSHFCSWLAGFQLLVPDSPEGFPSVRKSLQAGSTWH